MKLFSRVQRMHWLSDSFNFRPVFVAEVVDALNRQIERGTDLLQDEAVALDTENDGTMFSSPSPSPIKSRLQQTVGPTFTGVAMWSRSDRESRLSIRKEERSISNHGKAIYPTYRATDFEA